jgi:hypothetical protein
MGLDNYFERTSASPENVSFPDGLRLCGGMFSGHGSTGSFRGKVYREFFSENLGVDLYNEATPAMVSFITEQLAALIIEYPDQAWDGNEKQWVPDAPSAELGYYGVTAQEVKDLATLFHAASEQKLKLVSSY